jgi:hypothetical protein
VIVSGATATIASGEYHQSWIYLLLDFGEAAFGLVGLRGRVEAAKAAHGQPARYHARITVP